MSSPKNVKFNPDGCAWGPVHEIVEGFSRDIAKKMDDQIKEILDTSSSMIFDDGTICFFIPYGMEAFACLDFAGILEDSIEQHIDHNTGVICDSGIEILNCLSAAIESVRNRMKKAP